MTRDAELARIAELGRRVAALTPTDDARRGLVGYLAGTLYSLRKAAELGWDDAPAAGPDGGDYSAVASAVADAEAVDPTWLTGYFFGSALFRLAEVNERLGQLAAGTRGRDRSETVRAALAALRAEPRGSHTAGFTAAFGGALDVAERLCEDFEALSA
jgi:hypothetical protein